MTIIITAGSPDPEHGPDGGPGVLPLPGFTMDDTIVLRETVRAAMQRGMLMYLDPTEITTNAKQAGLGPVEIQEAFGELHRCRLLTAFGRSSAPVRVDLTSYGFTTGLPAAEPRAEEIRQALVTDLLDIDPADPDRWLNIRALADRHGTVPLVIDQLLDRLMDQGQIGFVTTAGGPLLTRVNPALRRQLP